MAGVSELQQVISAAVASKDAIAKVVSTISDLAKGPKGAGMKAAKETVKKAKVKLKLDLEYTKELIPLIVKQMEYEAVIAGLQTAYDTSKQTLKVAEDQVKTTKDDFEAVQKLMAKKNRKAQHGGEEPSQQDKEDFDKKKNAFDKAQEGLDKAKDGLKKLKESLDENKRTLQAILKEIAKIKVAMGQSVPQIPSEETATTSEPEQSQESSESTTNEDPPQNTSEPEQVKEEPAPEPSLSEEELEEAKKMGKERETAMQAEVDNLDPVLERMDAEWMVIENGMNVLQNLSAPLAQTAALPAFFGTGTPNTGFNFAVAGCIGLLAMFVLSEMNAAVVRWSALAQENEIEPDADKLAKINAITAFKASIPPCCAGGAGYVSAVVAQM